jgi:hypothetical protein
MLISIYQTKWLTSQKTALLKRILDFQIFYVKYYNPSLVTSQYYYMLNCFLQVLTPGQEGNHV